MILTDTEMEKGRRISKACHGEQEVNCLFREVDELQFDVRGYGISKICKSQRKRNRTIVTEES